MTAASPRARIYRMRSFQRIVGIILIVAGCFVTFAFWRGVLTGERDAKFLELFFPIVYLLFAILWTMRAYRNAVLLSADSIELRSTSGRRVLPISTIEGRRRYLARGQTTGPDVWHIVMVPNDDRLQKIDIEELYNFDDEFYAWFNSLPDLDELDKTRPKTSNFGLV